MVPHTCVIWCEWLMVPHTLYGIGIWLSPLPYMEQLSYGPPTSEVSSCPIWALWSHTLYGIGIISSPTCMHHPPHVLYNYYGPHSLYGIGILWSPYLIQNRYHMVPPHVCMVPTHVKCLHVLFASYGSPIPYMELVLYGPSHVHMIPLHVHIVPPHVQCDVNSSYVLPIPYMECRNIVTVNDSYGPPTCTIWFFRTMDCGNLVTVNDSYGPHTLYGIGILWFLLTLYGTGIVWSPSCT